MANRIMIIEDEDALRASLHQHLCSQGWQVLAANNINEARAQLKAAEQEPHVILADLGLPDGNLLDYIEQWQDHIDDTEWLFVTNEQCGALDQRLDTLAYDVLNKPLDFKRLDIFAARALRATLTRKRLKHYTKAKSNRYTYDAYIGSSAKVNQLKSLLKQLCEIPLHTLTIHGETGTGKGLVTRILHNNGLHKDGPLIEINCAALPKDLLESQLFGHEAGAFTGAQKRNYGLFEQADGGTLFLDEIGDMDIELQAKLLKVIEDGKLRRLGGTKEISINIHIISATGIDLEQAVKSGQFREDLYHRLSVFSVELPPLRERKKDLIELVPNIVAEFNIKANKKVDTITDAVWEQLLSYNWPGNIRELRNVIERCVLLSKGNELPAQWLQLSHSQDQVHSQDQTHSPDLDHQQDRSNQTSPADQTLTQPAQNIQDKQSINEYSPQKNTQEAAGLFIPLDGSLNLSEIEKLIIQKAVALHEGNVSQAAASLNCTRETLRYRIKKYKLHNSFSKE